MKGDAPTSLASTSGNAKVEVGTICFLNILVKIGSYVVINVAISILWSNVFFVLFHLQPWKPQCILEDFPTKIYCGDSWGEAICLLTAFSRLLQAQGDNALLSWADIASSLKKIESEIFQI